MPADRTVLESLLEGRSALVLEVERLTAAIADLDAVIGQIGGSGRRVAAADGTELDAERDVAPAAQSRPRATASTRRPVGKRAGRRGHTARTTTNDGQKSIRVHVLDMLADDDREFGLAEIIDRVHDAGIPAHDDAVRSITTKLMKDGKVERVGRGQYRLARHSTDGSGDSVLPAEQVEVELSAAESTGDAPFEPINEPADAPYETSDAIGSDEDPAPAYTPPLNLGQPWEQGR